MTTRDIRAHLREMYGVEVSADLISQVTDAVADELQEWQSRPLDADQSIYQGEVHRPDTGRALTARIGRPARTPARSPGASVWSSRVNPPSAAGRGS
jgi:hypothetical protein